MQPLPLKGLFTMNTMPRQNVIIVVRRPTGLILLDSLLQEFSYAISQYNGPECGLRQATGELERRLPAKGGGIAGDRLRLTLAETGGAGAEQSCLPRAAGVAENHLRVPPARQVEAGA